MSPDPPNKHADLRVHEHTFSHTTIILVPSSFSLPQLKILYETLVCVCVCVCVVCVCVCVCVVCVRVCVCVVCVCVWCV